MSSRTLPPTTFAAMPPLVPGHVPDETLDNLSLPVRRWNVTHACEATERILALAEAQLELGMRPALLTPDGWFNPAMQTTPAPPVSLVHAWRKVRHWRTVFSREEVGRPGEILHAHCFSAAMAGVRAGLPVVYDVADPLGSTTPNAGTWLLRSLRVAESFVVTRASAVVVHSQQNWNWALELGARAEDLFLVPDAVILPPVLIDHMDWLLAFANTRPVVTFFASSAGAEDLSFLLRAFAVVAEEIEGAHLLIESAAAETIHAQAAKLGISERIHLIAPEDRRRALSCCDVVIANTITASPNADAIDAFAYGRALLAADVASIREVSPNGRGCVWFNPGSERDIAFRASFLARNPDFRAALGSSGRAHLVATRGMRAVAKHYDDVYRHALKRHRSGTRPDIFHGVPALACC